MCFLLCFSMDIILSEVVRMKRIVVILAMISALFLSGCTTARNQTGRVVSKAKQEEYETYYRAVLENPVFVQSSPNYDISFEMNQIPDGTYRYYVILDQAKTAMYDVIMIAVENDTAYDSATKMMPSSGIFEDPVSLIPGQVNKKDGYAKGIVMSGETDQKSVDLKILVEWSNQDHTEKSREFIGVHLSPDGTTAIQKE